MRALLLSCLLFVPMGAAAQDRAATLADIRQELTVLFVEMQKLRRELSTTGSPGLNLPATALERLNAMEAEMSRLVALTEELEGRIDRIVADGTNRIGDLEFRLVELEGGDLGALGETSTLGGGALPQAPAAPGPTPGQTGELAFAEQADFDAAKAKFDAGDTAGAAEAFARYAETYPGGALSARAQYFQGRALEKMGDTGGAARAYLASFSGNPNSAESADALFRLGEALQSLGQTQEACITLGEVVVRFPGTSEAQRAEARQTELSCF